MADWYFSSAAYATLSAWAASHAYSVGDIIKPTAPATNAQYVMRCTTAGTSAGTEPTWNNTTNNATKVDGGVTWTNVTGQSTYGWGAAGGALYGNLDRPAVGDRVFLSSDHSETHSIGGNTIWTFAAGSSYGTIYVYSVNRAGSVPPVSADLLAGANLGTNASSYSGTDGSTNVFYQGVTFTHGGSANNFYIHNTSIRNVYFKDCTFALTTSGNASFVTSSGNPKVTFDNTKVTVNSANFNFAAYLNMAVIWVNTPTNALSGTAQPTSLFTQSSGGIMPVVMRGVDLSYLTGNILAEGSTGGQKQFYEGCKFNSSVTYVSFNSTGPTGTELEFVNCYDGAAFSARRTHAGAMITDRAVYMNGGAQDDGGPYSLKLVSNGNSDIWAMPLEAFWLDVENAAVGVSKTAVIELMSTLALNDTDIRLLLEYMGTSGNPLTSFVDSLTNPLKAAAALSNSINTWVAAVGSTWNTGDSQAATFSNGNLTVTAASGACAARGIAPQSTGKFYFEFPSMTGSQGSDAYGLSILGKPFQYQISATGCVGVNGFGVPYANGTSPTGGGGIGMTFAAGMGLAIDFGAGLWWVYNSGLSGSHWSNNGNPATGTGGWSLNGLTGPLVPYCAFFAAGSGQGCTANFGATSFTVGSCPSGFTAGWPMPTSLPRQLLQVSFTPQRVGRVRGLVRLGKPSTTVWVNPQISIS